METESTIEAVAQIRTILDGVFSNPNEAKGVFDLQINLYSLRLREMLRAMIESKEDWESGDAAVSWVSSSIALQLIVNMEAINTRLSNTESALFSLIKAVETGNIQQVEAVKAEMAAKLSRVPTETEKEVLGLMANNWQETWSKVKDSPARFMGQTEPSPVAGQPEKSPADGT